MHVTKRGGAGLVAVVLSLALLLAGCGSTAKSATNAPHKGLTTPKTTTTTTLKSTPELTTVPTTSTSTSSSTTKSQTTTKATSPPATSAPTVASTAPSTTLPALASPAGGLVVGHVTAVGDSVMLDYQSDLETDVPGVDVEAAVSRQWATGEQLLQQLRSEGRLGSVVVVALGTNGPITSADFDAMMSVLSGVSRVVFVNIVVDRPWQDPNNQVLASGVAQYSNTVIADWHSLEAQNPSWVYSDGTHLPIGGPGAQALAALIASKV